MIHSLTKKKTKVNHIFTNRRFIIHNMFFNRKLDKGEPYIYRLKVYIQDPFLNKIVVQLPSSQTLGVGYTNNSEYVSYKELQASIYN